MRTWIAGMLIGMVLGLGITAVVAILSGTLSVQLGRQSALICGGWDPAPGVVVRDLFPGDDRELRLWESRNHCEQPH